MVDVRFTDLSGVHIAYAMLNDGPRADEAVDIVVVAAAMFSFEMLLEDRVARRFVDGLCDVGRVVVFDKRGVGASDPITDWERSAQDQWADDLIAVVQASELDRPVLISWETFGVGRFAAARRPDLFRSMILVDPTPDAHTFVGLLGDRVDTERVASVEELAFPSRVDDPDFERWLVRAGRAGASPSTASQMWTHLLGLAGPMTPPNIQVDTLVLHRPDSMHRTQDARAVASLIDGAVLIEVAGRDAYTISGDVDPLLVEISRHVNGQSRRPLPDHVIAVVAFTDLVGSTERAALEGDEHWRALLDHHDEATRRIVEQHGGRVVKFTGDGALVEMPSARAALKASQALQRALAPSQLVLRIGIHAGDIDRRSDDLAGMTVNVAARIMSHADANEIVVTTSITEAAVGAGGSFEPLPPADLRGIPGTWALHRYRYESA